MSLHPMNTFAPFLAKTLAVSFPIPVFAPVTMTFLFLTSAPLLLRTSSASE